MKKFALGIAFIMLLAVIPATFLPNVAFATTTDQMSDTQLKSTMKPLLLELVNRQPEYRRLDFIRAIIVSLNTRLSDPTITPEKQRILTLIVVVLRDIQTNLSGDAQAIKEIEAKIAEIDAYREKIVTYINSFSPTEEIEKFNDNIEKLYRSLSNYLNYDGPIDWRQYYDAAISSLNVLITTSKQQGAFEGNMRYSKAIIIYREQLKKMVQTEVLELATISVKSKGTDIYNERIEELAIIIDEKVAKLIKALESESEVFCEEVCDKGPSLTDKQIDLYNQYYAEEESTDDVSLPTTSTQTTSQNMSKTIKTSSLVEAKYLNPAMINIDTNNCSVLVSEYAKQNTSTEYNKLHLLITNGSIFCFNSLMPDSYGFFGAVQNYYVNYFYATEIQTKAPSKAETSCKTPRVMYWQGKYKLYLDTNTCLWTADRTSGTSDELLTYCKTIYPNTTSVRLFAIGESSDSWESAAGTLYRKMMPSFECVQ